MAARVAAEAAGKVDIASVWPRRPAVAAMTLRPCEKLNSVGQELGKRGGASTATVLAAGG